MLDFVWLSIKTNANYPKKCVKQLIKFGNTIDFYIIKEYYFRCDSIDVFVYF